jgi:hypothetical protein
MIRNCWYAKLATCLFAATNGLAAQTPRVGHIERIAELRENARPVTLKDVTDRFQFRRGTGDWTAAGRNEPMFEQDRLRIARFIDVRLEVERPTQRGRLVFTHEVRDEDGGLVFQVPAGAGPANYVLGEDSAGVTELGLVVENGALVVDWHAGRLAVNVAGHRAIVVGTRAAFATDATGDTAVLYVMEGTVLLPATGMAAGAGQVVQLHRGVLPSFTSPTNQTVTEYREATQYNVNDIWSRLTPFWQKPAFLIPAAIGVGTFTVWSIVGPSGTDSERTGRVIVRIPFE